MTYQEQAALIQDTQFRGRVKVACLTFANRILSQGGGNPNSVLRWANQCMLSPDQTAQQMQPATVMQPAVQEKGTDIDDSTLQFAVENAIQRVL